MSSSRFEAQIERAAKWVADQGASVGFKPKPTGNKSFDVAMKRQLDHAKKVVREHFAEHANKAAESIEASAETFVIGHHIKAASASRKLQIRIGEQETEWRIEPSDPEQEGGWKTI